MSGRMAGIPRCVIWATIMALAGVAMVAPAFMIARWSAYDHKVPTLHDLSQWVPKHDNQGRWRGFEHKQWMGGGMGNRHAPERYLDPVLAVHYLGAWPWYSCHAASLPQPLQDPEIAIPATAATTWGLTGLLIGLALDRRRRKRIACSEVPEEAREAEAVFRRSKRAAAWFAGILSAACALTVWALPPMVTHHRIANLSSPDSKARESAMIRLHWTAVVWDFQKKPPAEQMHTEEEVMLGLIMIVNDRRTGDRLELAWDALLAAAVHPDRRTRHDAIVTLGYAGALHPEAAARAILPALKGEHEIGGTAIEALGRLKFRSKEVLDALAEATKDGSEWTRQSAISALGEFGPAAKDALPALRQALKDPDEHVSDAAEAAIWKIENGSDASPGRLRIGIELGRRSFSYYETGTLEFGVSMADLSGKGFVLDHAVPGHDPGALAWRFILTDADNHARELAVDRPEGARWTKDDFSSLTAHSILTVPFRFESFRCVETREFPVLLAPGKYTLAAVFECSGAVHSAEAPAGLWTGKVVSRPVAFEVTAPGATGEWSEAVNGIRVRMLVDTPVRRTAAGFFLSHVEAQNVSKAPISVVTGDLYTVSVRLTDKDGRRVEPPPTRWDYDYIMAMRWERIDPAGSRLFPLINDRGLVNVEEVARGSTRYVKAADWLLPPGQGLLSASFAGRTWGLAPGKPPADAWSGTLRTPPVATKVPEPAKPE